MVDIPENSYATYDNLSVFLAMALKNEAFVDDKFLSAIRKASCEKPVILAVESSVNAAVPDEIKSIVKSIVLVSKGKLSASARSQIEEILKFAVNESADTVLKEKKKTLEEEHRNLFILYLSWFKELLTSEKWNGDFPILCAAHLDVFEMLLEGFFEQIMREGLSMEVFVKVCDTAMRNIQEFKNKILKKAGM